MPQGDGHLSVGTRASRNVHHPEWKVYNASAGVTSAHYEILHWYHARWGGWITKGQITASPSIHLGSAGRLFSQSHKQWLVNHRALIVFLRDVMPHLKFKKTIAANVLALAELTALGIRPWTQTHFEKHRAFYDRHRKLMEQERNNRGREIKAHD